MATYRTYICLLAVACVLPGCLHREVTYTIGADGTAVVHFLARGDKADIERGLMPAKDAWTVKESEVTNNDGKKESVYDATRSFARVADIPPSYATPATRFPEAYLQTPIQFVVKDEGNAKVYEVALTYKARRWKEYQDLQAEIVGPKLTELVNRYGFQKLTPDERTSYCTAYVRWQLRLVHDRFATAMAGASLSGEKAQAILKQLDVAFDRIGSEENTRKILAQPEDTWGKALEGMMQQAKTEADKTLQEALASPQDAADRRAVRAVIFERY